MFECKSQTARFHHRITKINTDKKEMPYFLFRKKLLLCRYFKIRDFPINSKAALMMNTSLENTLFIKIFIFHYFFLFLLEGCFEKISLPSGEL